MTSLNPQVQELHQGYIDATGYDLALNIVTERFWYDALKWGICADDVKLVVKARIKRNFTLTHKRSLLIHKLVGDEVYLAEFMNELAEVKALQRKPSHCAGKIEVLQATGRAVEPEASMARHVSEIAIEALKQAAR